jgi:hypothetical protein
MERTSVSDTPKSDAAIEKLDVFVEAMRTRLEAGKREYGDSSFDRPIFELIEEIQQELLDTAIWSQIKWRRLEDMKPLVLEMQKRLGEYSLVA